MNKIKALIVALSILGAIGSCATVKVNGASEGVEGGTIYLTAVPIKSGNSTSYESDKLFKCIAANDTELTCGEVAVDLGK